MEIYIYRGVILLTCLLKYANSIATLSSASARGVVTFGHAISEGTLGVKEQLFYDYTPPRPPSNQNNDITRPSVMTHFWTTGGEDASGHNFQNLIDVVTFRFYILIMKI